MALSVETGFQAGLNLLNRHMNDFQEHNTRLCSLVQSEITRMTKFHQIRQMATKIGTGTSLVGLLVECASFLPAFKDSAQAIKSVGSFLESAGDLTKSGASFLDTIITRELMNELNELAQSYNQHAQAITRELTGLRTFANQRYRFEQLNDRNQQNIVNDLLPVIPLIMNGMSARDNFRQLRDECVGNSCYVTEESLDHFDIQLVETERGHQIKIDQSSKTTKTTQPPSGD